mmetsp:Transcript_10229/g.26577  ORF Transcript_10229/g.26577 Transcript_10229/m.26577 type:complete len:434 (+) Transcript_10229:53-1354(+)
MGFRRLRASVARSLRRKRSSLRLESVVDGAFSVLFVLDVFLGTSQWIDTLWVLATKPRLAIVTILFWPVIFGAFVHWVFDLVLELLLLLSKLTKHGETPTVVLLRRVNNGFYDVNVNVIISVVMTLMSTLAILAVPGFEETIDMPTAFKALFHFYVLLDVLAELEDANIFIWGLLLAQALLEFIYEHEGSRVGGGLLFVSLVVAPCGMLYGAFLAYTDTRLQEGGISTRIRRAFLVFPTAVVLTLLYPTWAVLSFLYRLVRACCLRRRPSDAAPSSDAGGASSATPPADPTWHATLTPLVHNPLTRRREELAAAGPHAFLAEHDLVLLSGCCWVWWWVPCCGFALCARCTWSHADAAPASADALARAASPAVVRGDAASITPRSPTDAETEGAPTGRAPPSTVPVPDTHASGQASTDQGEREASALDHHSHNI